MTREEIEALLPFYVNGTLNEAERAMVEAALAAEPSLRDEVAALSAIRENLQAEPAEYSPGEMGLARLMREVEAEAPAAAPRAPAEASARGAVTGVNRLWRIAAAVLLGVALVQGAFLLRGADRPGFELAGAREAALQVTVRPDTTEAALRAALLAAGLEIVAGPSALGVYGLAAVEADASAAAARDALIGSGLFETVDLTAEE
jgi:anti-sigma-K factor RskA